jgi:hypothetical protein
MTDAADDSERPLIAHLLELRTRLLRGVVGLVAGAALPAAVRQQVVRAAGAAAAGQAAQGRPADRHPSRLAVLRADEAGVLRCLVVAMPWLLYQAWAFVAPGLYRREKRWPCRCWLRVAAVLRRLRVRLLPGAADRVRLPRPGHPGRGGDDDRHQQLPRFRAGDLPGLRLASNCRWRW